MQSRKTPLFSVIIPAYNEEKYIEDCIKSVLNQDIPRSDYEVIVVNNASTDKTAKVAKKTGAKIINEPKKGTANARQAGFKVALGQIIATTDADTKVPTNWLKTFQKEFSKDPNLVAVSGMYNFYNGSPLLQLSTYLFNHYIFILLNWYSGANLAVRKNAFEKVGGFKTNIPISEDSDLCRKLKKIGKVKRLANFKVSTSARRFKNYGIIGGLYSYISTHIINRILRNKKHLTAGSEIKNER